MPTVQKALIPKPAFITTQGNLDSRKSHDPSGYVVMSGHWPKTFRGEGALKAAVKWCVKKGYLPKLTKPLRPIDQKAFVSLIEQAGEEVVAEAKARAAEEV